MTSNLAYAPIRRPREEDYQAPDQRHVRIVATRAQKRARPKLVYALLATAVIFAIFLAQLLISISLSSGAYQIDGLKATQQSLGRTSSALNERLNTLGSSQNLEANAIALGMVSSANAAYLQLTNGAVLGGASAATNTATTAEASGSDDSVANSLLTDIPVISTIGAATNAVQTKSTGSGHGGTNTSDSGSNSTESSKVSSSTTSVGSTTTASSASPDSGGIPSPVTH